MSRSTAQPTALDAAAVARLRLAVMRLSRLLRQNADTGVTPSQLSALATVDRNGPTSLGELAAFERVGPSTMTKIVAALEAAGLLERTTDPDDRRVAVASVTPAGHDLLERGRSSASSYLSERLDVLDDDEARALAAALPALERLVDQ